MKPHAKLDAGTKHIMRLILRDRKVDGWATVSAQLYPVLSSTVPPELVEFERLEHGGHAKLTPDGENVLEAMEWL